MKRLSKRTIASRANGAKSHGPTSTAGRRRSSANSLRHGLLAQSILLPDESKNVFGRLFDEHLQKLNPADGVEYAVVEEITAAAWRLRRIWDIEATLFTRAIERSTSTTEAGRAADAFISLGSGNQLQLLDRYETRLHRMYQRSLKTLEQLRDVPNVQAHPEPNEPSSPICDEQPSANDELPNEPKPLPTPSNESNLPAPINDMCERAILLADAPDPEPTHIQPNEPTTPQSPGEWEDPYAGLPRFEIHLSRK